MGLVACRLAAQAIAKAQSPVTTIERILRNVEAHQGDYQGAYGHHGYGRQGGHKKLILSHHEIQDEDSLTSVRTMAQL